MLEMTAVENSAAVSSAIAAWVDAFKKLGAKVNDDKWPVFWVREAGVWIRPQPDPDAAGSHWNALGVELNGGDRQKGIVHVNPPFNGSPPGINQGVVATDTSGVTWILRRSRLAIAGRKLELDDYPVIAERLKITSVLVRYRDGSALRCYGVAPIGDPATTVASTTRFVDFCRLVRKSAFEGTAAADIEQKVLGFEEPSGTYTIPARDAAEAYRFHHDVCEALKSDLSQRNFPHTNAKFGRLGPDLYTNGTDQPMLFESKTGNVADDILKAVGQLYVYEKLIGKPCRKIMILPEGVSGVNRDLVKSLDIEVIDYQWKPKIDFWWPHAFFEAADRRLK